MLDFSFCLVVNNTTTGNNNEWEREINKKKNYERQKVLREKSQRLWKCIHPQTLLENSNGLLGVLAEHCKLVAVFHVSRKTSTTLFDLSTILLIL